MANLPTLEELGKKDDSFLWVEINYNRKLIFPVEQGLKYIESMRGCLELHTPYEKPKKLVRFDSDAKFGYISKSEMEELIVAQELLGTGEENE